MPRQARKKSETGLYHVMIRGINRQQIFEDKEDNEKFLQMLRELIGQGCCALYAYCLMGNHAHVLLQEGAAPLEQIMKRLCCRYVYYFNYKYRRAGHLLQDRFKSEPVPDDAYLVTVTRYIHQNPVKTGLCRKSSGYVRSSYREYCNSDVEPLCERTKVLEAFGGSEQFIQVHAKN